MLISFKRVISMFGPSLVLGVFVWLLIVKSVRHCTHYIPRKHKQSLDIQIYLSRWTVLCCYVLGLQIYTKPQVHLDVYIGIELEQLSSLPPPPKKRVNFKRLLTTKEPAGPPGGHVIIISILGAIELLRRSFCTWWQVKPVRNSQPPKHKSFI